jgi:hypothetical protein
MSKEYGLIYCTGESVMPAKGPGTKKTKHFDHALQIGRPPNIVKLFPNSKALIVSG